MRDIPALCGTTLYLKPHGGERCGDRHEVGASKRAGGNPVGTAGGADQAVVEQPQPQRCGAGRSRRSAATGGDEREVQRR